MSQNFFDFSRSKMFFFAVKSSHLKPLGLCFNLCPYQTFGPLNLENFKALNNVFKKNFLIHWKFSWIVCQITRTTGKDFNCRLPLSCIFLITNYRWRKRKEKFCWIFNRFYYKKIMSSHGVTQPMDFLRSQIFTIFSPIF